MDVEVTSQALAAMRAAARAAHPREACGILLGERGQITAVCETANVHPTPATHFEIDPQALIDAHRAARAGGAAVVGYFHSHPAGQAVPSATDKACAARDGRIWAIIAGDAIRFWQDGEEGFAALSFTIIEG
jgi:proteasome lid subunit RPN8/RPN11